MTNTKTRLIIAASSVLVGCGGGGVGVASARPTTFPPSSTAPRWEQFCEVLDGVDEASINATLAARGAEGFELVATNDGIGVDIWFCFKRPAAPPPAAP